MSDGINLTEEEIKETIRNRIRQDRNKLLAQSDWSQLPDNSLTAEERNEWVQYRQQLRDIPSHVQIKTSYVTTINAMTWPMVPDKR